MDKNIPDECFRQDNAMEIVNGCLAALENKSKRKSMIAKLAKHCIKSRVFGGKPYRGFYAKQVDWYIAGYRDGRMHDVTLAYFSKTKGE